MRFSFDFLIPANTLTADPERLDVKLMRGVLRHGEVAFPPGPANLVHVVLRDASFQIAPLNPEQSLHWDDQIFPFDMNYELTDVGHTLTLFGWSPGTTFEHTITVHLDVEPKDKTVSSKLLQFLLGPGFAGDGA